MRLFWAALGFAAGLFCAAGCAPCLAAAVLGSACWAAIALLCRAAGSSAKSIITCLHLGLLQKHCIECRSNAHPWHICWWHRLLRQHGPVFYESTAWKESALLLLQSHACCTMTQQDAAKWVWVRNPLVKQQCSVGVVQCVACTCFATIRLSCCRGRSSPTHAFCGLLWSCV